MGKRRPYIWLQENELSGRAVCGCELGNSSGGSAVWLCPIHEAAPELLKALERLMPLWDRDDVKEEYDAEFESAYQAIARAKRRRGRQGRNQRTKK